MCFCACVQASVESIDARRLASSSSQRILIYSIRRPPTRTHTIGSKNLCKDQHNNAHSRTCMLYRYSVCVCVCLWDVCYATRKFHTNVHTHTVHATDTMFGNTNLPVQCEHDRCWMTTECETERSESRELRLRMFLRALWARAYRIQKPADRGAVAGLLLVSHIVPLPVADGQRCRDVLC